MARSPAWRSLSGGAIKVWVELRSRFWGGNNGDLSLSLEEGAHLLGIGKATVRRAFVELQEKGFVVMTHRGHWMGRKAATWRVTDKSWKGYPPSREYQHWTPPPATAR